MARFKSIVARKQTFEWRLVETLPAFAARACNAAAVLIASVLLLGGAAAQVPEVTGPIPAVGPPGTDLTHNYPQLASAPNFDLSSRGYIEEEFFFQGAATQYQVPAIVNGRVTSTADATVVSTGNPYKTRMLVRRPANPQNFNGVVLVEWVNVTSGYNLDANWEFSRDYLTREGYAWVGVSAQRVGVQQPPYGLTAWSPTRYGTLDVTVGGKITNDSLSYDIYSQAGRAIRTNRALLGGLKTKMVLAIGVSQSSFYLMSYYNSIQRLASYVYDGFMLVVGSGGPFRTDLKTKLFRINTETEILLGLLEPQADSNVLRSWEIAGSSHVNYWAQMFRQGLVARDGLAPFVFTCDLPPLSHVHNEYVLNAGYEHLVNWVAGREQPPTAPLIQTTGPSTSPTIPRDQNGLAFGGVRLADVDVPIATNTGGNSGPVFCILYGSHVPFGPDKISSLYPNHDSYVDAVTQVTLRDLKAGYILKEDAELIISDAVNSPVGTAVPLPIP
jgi:hypothetical protein